MEITKLSTKGQIVIPESLRKNIEVGTPFIVSKQNNLLILKQVEEFTEEEIKEIKELDAIWKDIDEGKGITMTEEEFRKELTNW